MCPEPESLLQRRAWVTLYGLRLCGAVPEVDKRANKSLRGLVVDGLGFRVSGLGVRVFGFRGLGFSFGSTEGAWHQQV